MAETQIIAPTANGLGGLGASDRKWKDVYAKNGSIEALTSTSITTGKIVADDIVNSKGEPAGGLNILARSKAYAEGDIAYSAKLPSWGFLTCTTAGTSNSAEIDLSGLAEGDSVTDGTVVWTLKRVGSGGGGAAYIRVTAPAGAKVTCASDAKTYTGIVGDEGSIDFEVYVFGEYTVSGIMGDKSSVNSETVDVSDISIYSVSLAFASVGTLNVIADTGAKVTVVNGGFSAVKTVVADNHVAFPIYTLGAATVSAKIGDIPSNIATVNFAASGEIKNAEVKFIKLVLKGVENESVTISKGSFSYNKVIDNTLTANVYLPETGNWSCVGVGSKGGSGTKTKNRTVNITDYDTYNVNMWSTVYGIYVDQSDSVESTCVHQVANCDNAGFTPLKINFTSNVENNTLSWGSWQDSFIMPKPCMLKHDGTVAYYLDPDDYTKKADGSASDVSNTSFDGEAMMEWVPIFTKVVNDTSNDRIYMYFSDDKDDENYECYSALKSDGSYAEHWYTPIYEGSVISSKMRSLSTGAKPTSSTTMAGEMTAARALGDGWDITCWADEDLLRCLGILVTERLNSEAAIGAACGSSSSALTHNCGTANKKGMFFGHSGTSAYATKYFGMENWWGHRWRRCTGLLTNDYKVYVKMTKHNGDGSTISDYSSTDVTGYINAGVTVPAGNESYIKKMAGVKNAVTVPTVVSGASSTTGYCDGFWSANALRAPVLGGSVNCGALVGLFAFAVNAAPSYSHWDVSASLSYKAL